MATVKIKRKKKENNYELCEIEWYIPSNVIDSYWNLAENKFKQNNEIVSFVSQTIFHSQTNTKWMLEWIPYKDITVEIRQQPPKTNENSNNDSNSNNDEIQDIFIDKIDSCFKLNLCNMQNNIKYVLIDWKLQCIENQCIAIAETDDKAQFDLELNKTWNAGLNNDNLKKLRSLTFKITFDILYIQYRKGINTVVLCCLKYVICNCFGAGCVSTVCRLRNRNLTLQMQKKKKKLKKQPTKRSEGWGFAPVL